MVSDNGGYQATILTLHGSLSLYPLLEYESLIMANLSSTRFKTANCRRYYGVTLKGRFDVVTLDLRDLWTVHHIFTACLNKGKLREIECSDCLKIAVPKMVSALTLWNDEEISQLRTVSVDETKCKESQTILSNPMSSQGKAQDLHRSQEVTDLRNSISLCLI